MKKTDRKNLLKAVDLLKMLSHPVRLSILCDLMERDEMSAGEIVEHQAAMASQSQVSQYLAEFRRRKYVKVRKDGQNVYYTFSSPLIRDMIVLLHAEYCKKK